MEVLNKIVSIIIPCFNQAEFVAEAIESVLSQTYADWECIIVDDGSPDHTGEVVSEFLIRDSRIKYFKKENEGVSEARNYGISKAVGEYILPLDGDDRIANTYLEKAVAILEDKSIKVVYCEAEFFGAKSGKWDIIDYSPEMMVRHNLIFCSAFYRRKDFYSTLGYNTNMKYGLEDWDFWIGMLKQGGRVVRIPEVLFYYRIKEQSRNVEVDNKKMQMMYMQVYLNHPEFFDRYYESPIEVLADYSYLKKLCNELQEDNSFLKGIIKFNLSSYKMLFKKLLKH